MHILRQPHRTVGQVGLVGTDASVLKGDVVKFGNQERRIKPSFDLYLEDIDTLL